MIVFESAGVKAPVQRGEEIGVDFVENVGSTPNKNRDRPLWFSCMGSVCRLLRLGDRCKRPITPPSIRSRDLPAPVVITIGRDEKISRRIGGECWRRDQ